MQTIKDLKITGILFADSKSTTLRKGLVEGSVLRKLRRDRFVKIFSASNFFLGRCQKYLL